MRLITILLFAATTLGLDLKDFLACGSGPAIPVARGCESADLDGDGDADSTDFGMVQTTGIQPQMRLVPSQYATIAKAYAAASDGDVIEMAGGTYDADTEAGGGAFYLDLNRDISVTFQPSTGATVAIVGNQASCIVRSAYDAAAKTITFNDISLSTSLAGATGINQASACAAALRFNRCTINTGTGRLIQSDEHASVSRDIEFNDCTLTSNNNYPIWVSKISRLIVSGGTFTGTATNGKTANVTGVCGLVKFTGATWNVRQYIFRPTNITSLQDFVFAGNTVNMNNAAFSMNGVTWPDKLIVGSIRIENNTFNSLSSVGWYPIVLGTMCTATWPVNSIPHVSINGNAIAFASGDARSIGIQTGLNVNSGQICRNSVQGGYAGLFIASTNLLIEGNKVRSKNAFIGFGCRNSHLRHNTFVGNKNAVPDSDSRAAVLGRWEWFGGSLGQGSTSTTYAATSVTIGGTPDLAPATSALAAGWTLLALSMDASNDPRWGFVSSIASPVVNLDHWRDFNGVPTTDPTNGHRFWVVAFPQRMMITDNIFDGGGAEFCINFDYIPAGISDHWCDYNAYRAGSRSLSNLGAAKSNDSTIANLAGLRSTWATMAATRTLNDANSIEADPMLTDPATGNFTISYDSPALNAASDGKSIGAEQKRACPSCPMN